ncbi:hypothetical protein AVEN_171665-1 [Araneus ventricosus]|uniref:Uncharacterized protein n=1 Tax=Araneus ventricosus TaxID=182803 RepID=A0A4Y2I6K2_ARAVE|nr:hypothetical protein AVEN_171665-1 [Araneus ventricosus]
MEANRIAKINSRLEMKDSTPSTRHGGSLFANCGEFDLQEVRASGFATESSGVRNLNASGTLLTESRIDLLKARAGISGGIFSQPNAFFMSFVWNQILPEDWLGETWSFKK